MMTTARQPNPPVDVIRVLVVDDHPVIRRALSDLLSAYEALEVVDEAADGVEGLEALGRNDAHVVILNYVMPRMDGAETARKIRARWPHVGIIGLSADTAGDEMESAGAHAFVLKDAGVEPIVAAIRRLVGAGNAC